MSTEMSAWHLPWPYVGLALILAITFWLSVVVIQAARTALDPRLGAIPGPPLARWTNLPLKQQVLMGRRAQYIHSLHERFGTSAGQKRPYVRIAPTEIAICDVEAIKTIHRVNSDFTKSDWYKKIDITKTGSGIFFMTDPKQHATRRRLFAQPFANSSILTFEGRVRKKAQMAIDKIQRDATLRYADVLKWWTFFATDVAGELSFGASFEMLETEQKTEYIRDLETALMITGIRAELDALVTLAQLLPIPNLQAALSLPNRLQRYGEQAMQKLRTHSSPDSGTPSCLFTRFLKSQETHGLTEAQLAREASNFIVAGSDTTAVSLTYLTWAVLHPRNSKVLLRLRDELSSLPLDTPAKDIAQLPYLDAVINETLRLYGAAPGSLPRRVPSGGVFLNGYEIPEGTTVSTQAFTTHRLASVFPEPESFRPERWLDPTPAMKDAFAPFGGGARTCLGVHLAMMELRLAAFLFFKRLPHARLVSPERSDEEMDFENYFLIAPKAHKCEITLR